MARTNPSSGENFGVALSPGLHVGGARYLLRRLVGRGEFSEVWLARDIKAVKDMALKFLPRAFLSDENLVERFEEEIRRNRLLKHPNIISICELARDHGSAAIVMEFVDGWSLATLKVDKLCHCYTVEEIEPWIRQLGGALAYAHNEFGLVHGDLKPSNLLVSARDGIKVSDFGFAALIRSECSRRGIIKGGYSGIGFLSPQQVMGEPPSKLDDVYSLGATIFDLLSGTPPFYKGEIIAQVCSLKPPTMTKRLEELAVQCDPISPVWEDTVATCLAKNPADRPQSVDEVLRLLGRTEMSAPVLPQMESKVTEPITDTDSSETAEIAHPAEPPPVIQSSPRRKLVMFAGAFVMLLVIGLAAAFWFARSGNTLSTLSPNRVAMPVPSPPGSLDKSFNTGTSANFSIRCVAVQPDGKILVGGFFSEFDGAAIRRIARLNPNGAVDTTFAPQPPGRVHAIALQSDGKILIGGEMMEAKHRGRNVIRLNAAGGVDELFGSKANYNREVRTIAVQPDGKVLVGGSFTRVSGEEQNRLVRLDADGKRDDSFDIGGGAPAIVWAIAVQPDGKILVAGTFARFNGKKVGHLVRLNPDGHFDPNFDDGSGADAAVMGLDLQTDGKILISGDFACVNGVLRPHIARLDSDGSLDTSFIPGNETNAVIRSMAVQSDGKIVIGGFDNANGKTYPYVARLNADGSLDENFKVNEENPGVIWRVALQSDGKILVVGGFRSLDGVLCGGIARLQN